MRSPALKRKTFDPICLTSELLIASERQKHQLPLTKPTISANSRPRTERRSGGIQIYPETLSANHLGSELSLQLPERVGGWVKAVPRLSPVNSTFFLNVTLNVFLKKLKCSQFSTLIHLATTDPIKIGDGERRHLDRSRWAEQNITLFQNPDTLDGEFLKHFSPSPSVRSRKLETLQFLSKSSSNGVNRRFEKSDTSFKDWLSDLQADLWSQFQTIPNKAFEFLMI
jgi:hypothetical protein